LSPQQYPSNIYHKKQNTVADSVLQDWTNFNEYIVPYTILKILYSC